MRVETIYENKTLYRENFKIQGYYFGYGKKSVCIVGNMRGNEYQQLYTCSKVLQALKDAQEQNWLAPGFEILVIPSANPYSMNVEKRFWPIDNTDINRMFPGYMEGETTQRIAGGLFEKIKDYQYGIQFASNYIQGEFMPYVSIMETGFEDADAAKAFGLPYIVLRRPRPYDTTTLNYNWQIWGAKAYSVYTTATDVINKESANRAVNSVLSFLQSIGALNSDFHFGGYVSRIIHDDSIVSVRCTQAGLFEPTVQVEETVREGSIVARVLRASDGCVLEELRAPVSGTVFFMNSKPLCYGHTAVIKIIPHVISYKEK